MDKNEFLKDVIDKGKKVHERALKPCPFCGGRKISLYQVKDVDGYWRHYFRCCACGAQSSVREYPRATVDPNLRDLWNNRINEGYTEVKRGKWEQEKAAILISSMKTHEVQPVKPAHWSINPDGYYPQCSNCGYEPPRELIRRNGDALIFPRYCPECGADTKREVK